VACPRNWHELFDRFPDYAARLGYLERLRPGEGFKGRVSGTLDGGWRRLRQCASLRRCLTDTPVSVTAGTILAGTRTPQVVRGLLVCRQPEAGRQSVAYGGRR
jgi:hypothetical protein